MLALYDLADDRAGAWCDQWEGLIAFPIIVGGDPVVALEMAAQTPMHDDWLPVRALKTADRRHRSLTRAGAIAGTRVIDMA